MEQKNSISTFMNPCSVFRKGLKFLQKETPLKLLQVFFIHSPQAFSKGLKKACLNSFWNNFSNGINLGLLNILRVSYSKLVKLANIGHP